MKKLTDIKLTQNQKYALYFGGAVVGTYIIIQIIKAIQKYELAMEAEDGMLISDSIMEMDDLGAWDFEAKVKQILGKLNIHHLQK